MSFLVTGATGNVGRHVVGELAAAGESVRAVTRTPARATLPAGVDVVAGDLDQPESLRAAMTGIHSMYLFPVPQTAPEVVRLAVEAGVRRIVVLSSSSVLEADNHSGQYHLAVEQAVEASGLEWTHVRPGEFSTNVLWKWGSSIRTGGVVQAPYPDAVRVLIHEADVAAVAVAALRTDDLVGERLELTGPEQLTQVQQVEQIAAAIGRSIKFEEISPDEARQVMGAVMPPPVVEMVLGYLAASVESPPLVLPTVEKVLGRPALTFGQWAADHAADFRAIAA